MPKKRDECPISFPEIIPVIEEEFRKCNCVKHSRLSKYPKNRVPIHLFIKNGKELARNCKDCRDYKSANKKKNDNKRKIKSKEENERIKNQGKRYCHRGELHENISSYDRDDVPAELFLKPNGEFYEFCQDCRNVNKKHREIRNGNNLNVANLQGKHFCKRCSKNM